MPAKADMMCVPTATPVGATRPPVAAGARTPSRPPRAPNDNKLAALFVLGAQILVEKYFVPME